MEVPTAACGGDGAASAAPPASAAHAHPGGRGASKPSKSDDPGPVRHGLSAAQRTAMQQKRAEAQARNAKLHEAGAVASRDLSAAQVGVVRSSLFDADDWRREHAARAGRMQATFSRLYQPQAGKYWTQKQKAPPRKASAQSSQLPGYTDVLPAALSLAHPSAREQPSDDEGALDNDDDESSVPAHPAAEFDPMAEPRRFYADFKGRVAALRAGAKTNPEDRTTQVASLPRAADAVVAAATAPSPPPLPPAAPPAAIEPPSWSIGGGSTSISHPNPILDDDFDVEPSLVYTDSAHYLADHGVQIPMCAPPCLLLPPAC